jgi:hypothetical protein
VASQRFALFYDAANGRTAMSEKTARIGEILEVMKSTWDLARRLQRG